MIKILIILTSVTCFANINESRPIDFKPITKKIMPAFKKGDCLSFNKKGENFWKGHESQFLKISNVGKANFKSYQILFVKENNKLWTLNAEFPILTSFSDQHLFSKRKCPDKSHKVLKIQNKK